jgi:hypothetical protein
LQLVLLNPYSAFYAVTSEAIEVACIPNAACRTVLGTKHDFNVAVSPEKESEIKQFKQT